MFDVCMSVCSCVRACACSCVRVCVCVRVRLCARASIFLFIYTPMVDSEVAVTVGDYATRSEIQFTNAKKGKL